MVPSWRRKSGRPWSRSQDPTSSAAEAYRSLRTSLQFARQDRELRTILVTSPARARARPRRWPTWARCSPRRASGWCWSPATCAGPGRPVLRHRRRAAELSSVLTGQRSLEEALAPVPGTEGLWALSTWTVTPNPTELLSGQRMRNVFAELPAAVRRRAHRQPAGAAGRRRDDPLRLRRRGAAGRRLRPDPARRTAAHRGEAGPGERAGRGRSVLNKATAQARLRQLRIRELPALRLQARCRGPRQRARHAAPVIRDARAARALRRHSIGWGARMTRAVLACGGIVVAAEPLTIALLRRLAVIDVPGGRSSHSVPTPRGGGAPIAVGLLVAAGLALEGGDGVAPGGLAGPGDGLAGPGGEALGVRSRGRLLRRRSACSMTCAGCLRPGGWRCRRPAARPSRRCSSRRLDLPVPLLAVAALVLMAWLAGFVNAFNFMDGVNGISAAHALIGGVAYACLGAWRGDAVPGSRPAWRSPPAPAPSCPGTRSGRGSSSATWAATPSARRSPCWPRARCSRGAPRGGRRPARAVPGRHRVDAAAPDPARRALAGGAPHARLPAAVRRRLVAPAGDLADRRAAPSCCACSARRASVGAGPPGVAGATSPGRRCWRPTSARRPSWFGDGLTCAS